MQNDDVSLFFADVDFFRVVHPGFAFQILAILMIRVVAEVFILTLIGFVFGNDGVVTCGSVVKLVNVQTKARLHSHDVKYGSGSGQQSITGMTNSDDVNSHWQLLGGKIFFVFEIRFCFF